MLVAAYVCRGCVSDFRLASQHRCSVRRYDNCELRTVVLHDQGGGGGLDRTWWHPKGHHMQASQ